MVSTVLLVVVFIGVLITIHELGHLVAAKLSGISVEVFSLGFGPTLLRKRFRGTEYRLSLVPLGGFIKMTGEEGPTAPNPSQRGEENQPVSATGATPANGSYVDKPLGIRVAVVAAGPVSNLILGFVLMFVMYLSFGVKYLSPVLDVKPGSHAEKSGLMTGDLVLTAAGETIPSFETFENIVNRHRGQTVLVTLKRNEAVLSVDYVPPIDSPDIEPMLAPIVDRVRAGSPAARLGLRPGDRILSIADRPVSRWEDFVTTVVNHGGKSVTVSWEREGTVYIDTIVPTVEKDPVTDERFGQIGVWVRLPKRRLSLPTAFIEAARRTGRIAGQTFAILAKVVTGRVSTRAIGGPIMVAKVAYEGATWGPEYFVALWALLSINLFVVNMIPIPVMDGGRILLDLFGAVRRRRLSERELTWAANIGWALIGILIIFTLFNDVIRLVRR